jgi:hypothetical protein
VADDVRWAAGDGLEISGPIGALLLVLTARPAGLRDVTGPGAVRLRQSLAAIDAGRGG